MKKKKITFDEYYTEQLGDRWQTLKDTFKEEPCYYEFKEGLNKTYYLDEASYLCALELGVMPGDRVLDMCAAPGGKSLVLALAMGPTGSMISNDRSTDRRIRLKRVLTEHLPSEIRECIRVTGYDASRWGLNEQDEYDRILLDAPCSSERHVYLSEKHLKQWSPSRTKSLAHQQYALAVAALTALKPGGTMIYSTCALSPLENDGVIKKLLKKKNQAELLPLNLEFGEATEYGWTIWPDTGNGRGPIYLSRLTKKA